MKSLVSLLWGILFGAGLSLSGMLDTAKVIGFLNIFGDWKPDLLFVMASALMISIIGYRLCFKSSSPIFAYEFSLPKTQVIDSRLLLGAILFGTGWGLYGYCPGPAIASIIYLNVETVVFIIAMMIGMYLVYFSDKALLR